MTQREALTNILTSISHPTLRRLFVCRWLEDINWHGECQQLAAGLTQAENKAIEKMEKEVDSTATDYYLPFNRYDFRNANERLLPGFVYAFGWGITPDEWQSDGSGSSFVAELEQMIKQPEPVHA